MGTPIKITKLKNDQTGFASIVIALVMILVLSLITIGFAQLMRNEQTSALSKQLSSQAYYAAESGINQAMSAISNGFQIPKTTCGPYASPPSATQVPTTSPSYPAADQYLTSDTVSTNTASTYPCLLINPNILTATYSNVSTSVPTVFELLGTDATGNAKTVNTIEISWAPPATTPSASFNDKCGQTPDVLSPASDTADLGNTGMIQAEIIPIPASGNVDRQSLINDSFTVFLCPNGGGVSTAGTVAFPNPAATAGANSGAIVDGDCNTANPPTASNPALVPTPLFCNSEINVSSLGQSLFFVELQSIYNPTQVTVSAYDNTSPNPISTNNQDYITGAETEIDSTGKAQDVEKRIQVRVADTNGYTWPTGSAGVQSICKQLQLAPQPDSSDQC